MIGDDSQKWALKKVINRPLVNILDLEYPIHSQFTQTNEHQHQKRRKQGGGKGLVVGLVLNLP